MKILGKMTAYGQVLNIKQASYDVGIAIQLTAQDGSPFGTLSVNIEGAELEEGEFLAKTWFENEPLRAPALESGIFADTGKRVTNGFVTAEVWRLVQP